MKKILIAEDNNSNYILMTYILKKYYQFERATNGQEAVDKVEAGDFDIVLRICNSVLFFAESTGKANIVERELDVLSHRKVWIKSIVLEN